MSTLQVVDFTDGTSGLLVKRSAHYLDQHNGRDEEQLGIIVGREFYTDEAGAVICWPIVHWEGKPTESTIHPVNLTPYREHQLPTIEMVE